MIHKTLAIIIVALATLAARPFTTVQPMAPDGKALAVKSIQLPNRVKLEYVEQGNVASVPVILLHGYTDSWHSFELVLPHLPKTIRAFALSQRGHGDSERPATGYRPEDFSADVAAFMDALKLKHAVIVGHSMGSQVALRFALDHSERISGLVLVGAFRTVRGHTGVKDLWDTTISKMADPVDYGFVREFQKGTLHKPVPAAFLETAVQESAKVPARVWRSAMAGLMETDFSSEISRIKLQTLIVWGDQDLFCPRSDQDALVATIKKAQLLTYSGTGHAPHWEEPGRFAADLTAFVGRLAH
jgi:pimeloyl-ACP methyl ester carboxylesterase